MKKTPWRKLFLVFLISFVLFYPSLNYFFTHDDFFLLKISNAKNLNQFVNFFNLFSSPEGLGMYRPLSMQSYYLLGIKAFNLNPFWLHVVSFITFFVLLYLIYKFVTQITKNSDIALMSTLLYATSATHFTHLYFLGVYQELLMSVFVIAAMIYYLKFLIENKLKDYIFVIIFFILGILSKENALILPLMFVITLLYYVKKGVVKHKSANMHIVYLLPMFLLVGGYMYLRFNYYGLPQGDSYMWDFSTRVINSTFWYILWSFNIPEMFVDFIGPGIKVNPNLFKFWGMETKWILSLFIVFVMGLIILVAKSYKKVIKEYKLIIYFVLWFLVFLLPFIFLPLHKFTYYLTLSLIGVVVLIALVIEKGTSSRLVKYLFILCWILMSLVTLNLTKNTHWVTKGSQTAKNLHEYFNETEGKYSTVVFYDTPEDSDLPWSPSDVVRTTLSEYDYFIIFSPEVKDVKYLQDKETDEEEGVLYLESRQFLGY